MRVSFPPEVEGTLRSVGTEAAALGFGAWAVGGVVRDAMLGHPSKDVDVALDGEPSTLVQSLAKRWVAALEQRDRFSTATLIRPDGYRVDFVRTRSETYQYPGALPEVEPGDIIADLERRDFTVNAMAASASPDDFGALLDPFQGQSDLEGRTLRTLHRNSFTDDPTRLFRAARYAVRYGLTPDDLTETAARDAVSEGALATISADRRRNEVMAICGERQWAKSISWLNRWDVWASLGDWEPGSTTLQRADAVLNWAHRAVSEPLPAATEFRWLTLLVHAPETLWTALAAKPAEQSLVRQALDVFDGYNPADEAGWRRSLDDRPLAVVLAAMTLTRSDVDKGRLTHYIAEIRPRRLSVTGDDLVAAGATPGPALGQALRATLDAVRANTVTGREAELDYAMQEWKSAQEPHAA